MILYFDTETSSPVPIGAGAARYHEASEVILLPWAVDDEPVQVWEPKTQDIPAELARAWLNADKVVVHNIGFDYLAAARLRWLNPLPSLERWRCTMHQAYAHGLPGSLGLLSELYELGGQAKLDGGKDLMRLFCDPKHRADRTTHPEKWAQFVEYARRDVEATRALYKKLPKWNLSAFERAAFEADFHMNQKGIHVDVAFAQSVVEALEAEKSELSANVEAMTAGAVTSANQRDKLLKHVAKAYGVALPDLRSATVEAALKDEEVPDTLKQLLKARLSGSTSSTAKYKKLLQCALKDDRLRGTMQWRGASRTGRVGHRLFQPGNLPRPTIPKAQVEVAIQAFQRRAPDLLRDVMAAASSCVRGAITAPEGKKLLVGDWANIEGRIAAWTAGEAWKLEAYRAYDRGEGPDLYKLAYSRAFGVPVDQVDDRGRQMGKVQELFLQYGGGVGAFVLGAAAAVPPLDLDDVTKVVLDAAPEEVVAEAQTFYKWWTQTMHKSDYGLPFDTFVACDAIKRLWRRQHPMIVKRWFDLEESCRRVLGTGQSVGSASKVKNWVRLALPSGRFLSYPNMRVGKEANAEDDERETLVFQGAAGKTKQWGRLYTHGGKLFENETQAIAADVLACAMIELDGTDIQPVLTVHDELVCEADSASLSAELKRAMELLAVWMDGLPLKAEVFSTLRYRKG